MTSTSTPKAITLLERAEEKGWTPAGTTSHAR
jgi:hypothetical protein